MADTVKKLKIVIIVLSVLLGISIVSLIGIIIGQIYLPIGSAVIPDNYIEPVNSGKFSNSQFSVYDFAVSPVATLNSGSHVLTLSKTIVDSDRAKETVISIYKNQPEDSEPFICPNMFPGDRETKTYHVEVSHKGTVTVRFHADIRSGYEKLAEVLKCQVVIRNFNKIVYDGLMRDMPESINHRISSDYGKTTNLTYDITVYLDTSVGNDYMNKELIADFRWWVEESGGYIPPIPWPEDPDEPDDSGEQVSPDVPIDPDLPDTPEIPDEPIDPEDPQDPDDPVIPDEPLEPDKPDDPIIPDEPEDPDDGELIDPPPTSDSLFIFWICVALISVIFVVILLSSKKIKKEENIKNEQYP